MKYFLVDKETDLALTQRLVSEEQALSLAFDLGVDGYVISMPDEDDSSFIENAQYESSVSTLQDKNSLVTDFVISHNKTGSGLPESPQSVLRRILNRFDEVGQDRVLDSLEKAPSFETSIRGGNIALAEKRLGKALQSNKITQADYDIVLNELQKTEKIAVF